MYARRKKFAPYGDLKKASCAPTRCNKSSTEALKSGGECLSKAISYNFHGRPSNHTAEESIAVSPGLTALAWPPTIPSSRTAAHRS